MCIDTMGPYGSYGNGSAMRVSPVAYAGSSLLEVERLAKWSAEVTHDHSEGIKGAQSVAAAIYLAKEGKDEIRDYIEDKYYDLDFTLDEIRPSYRFDVTCMSSVPQAIECLLEAHDLQKRFGEHQYISPYIHDMPVINYEEKLKKPALKQNDTDPEHNYLIGLAYLEGIDVKTDS